MALSSTVSDALSEAEASLRNALSFAARQERPMVCAGVADLMQRLEAIMSMDKVLDKIETNMPDSFFGPFKIDDTDSQ